MEKCKQKKITKSNWCKCWLNLETNVSNTNAASVWICFFNQGIRMKMTFRWNIIGTYEYEYEKENRVLLFFINSIFVFCPTKLSYFLVYRTVPRPREEKKSKKLSTTNYWPTSQTYKHLTLVFLFLLLFQFQFLVICIFFISFFFFVWHGIHWIINDIEFITVNYIYLFSW